MKQPISQSAEQYCTIHIVRHGQTDLNAQKRLTGHKNPVLNNTGIQQAHGLRERLKNIRFDAVFSSDLTRTIQTAKIIALERNLAVQTSALIRERNYGQYGGRHVKEVEAELKDLLRKYETLTQEEEQWQFKFTQDMESDDEVAGRFVTFLREISVVYKEKTVLVVTSSGPFRTFLMHVGYAKKSSLKRGAIKNGGYVEIASDGVDFFVLKEDALVKEKDHVAE